MKLNRKRISLGVGALAVLTLGCFAGPPAWLLFRAWYHDRPQVDPIAAGAADDASRLNRTKVAEVWDIPSDSAAAEKQLQKLLERARADKLGVSIAGRRHSMGGHTIWPDGIQINMLPFAHLELDADAKILHAGAGA